MTYSPSTPNTVLVVDDNPTNLEVLHSALGNNGLEVWVATDGESAIEQATYSPPDLILLDVLMPPGIDGFETCRRLKKTPATQDIPVLFMTAGLLLVCWDPCSASTWTCCSISSMMMMMIL